MNHILFCPGNNNNVLTQRTLSIFQNVTQECLMSDSRAYMCNGNRFTMCLPSSVYSSSSAPPSAEWEKKMKEQMKEQTKEKMQGALRDEIKRKLGDEDENMREGKDN